MSFLDFLNPISSVVGGVGSLVNGFQQNQIAKDNYNLNAQIAQDNLQFQKDNLDYQKALQQQIFAREDTSYQRTVNDMRQAGLSPLSMSGTNTAGSVISTSAPQRQSQDATNRINALNNSFNAVASSINTVNSVVNSQKQNQLLQTEIDSNNIDNATRRLKNLSEIRNVLVDIGLKGKQLATYDRLFEDSLLNSASNRSLQSSQSDLNKSSAELNKSLKQEKDDYNSLHDIRKYILDNQKYMSDYERQKMLSNLNRLLRDNNFMERFGLTDSMSDDLKSLGIDLSDSDLFDFGSPTVNNPINSRFNEVRKMRRAGRSLKEFKNSAGSAFEEKLLMSFAQLLGVGK